jgi:hypothetical protein
MKAWASLSSTSRPALATIVSRTGRAKLFYVSALHPERLSKSGRMPAIADSICPDDAAGTRCPAVRFSLTKASSQSWSVVLGFKGVCLSLKANPNLLKHLKAVESTTPYR